MPVLILLAIVWAIVLVPPFVRNRADLRPGASVSSFRNDLAVLGRATPSTGLPPAPGAVARVPADRLQGTPAGRSAARKRRRDVFLTLLGAAGFTLLLALAFGGPMIALHVLVDVSLAGYAYLLVQVRKLSTERTAKVRYLAAPPQSQPRLVTVRRTAASG